MCHKIESWMDIIANRIGTGWAKWREVNLTVIQPLTTTLLKGHFSKNTIRPSFFKLLNVLQGISEKKLKFKWPNVHAKEDVESHET